MVVQDEQHDLQMPLHLAAMQGNTRRIRKLLKSGISTDSVNEAGQTALFCACYEGNLKVVIYLLAHGADPNIKSHKGITALHVGAFSCKPPIMRSLVAYGGDLRPCDDEGWSVYDWAMDQPDTAKSKNMMDYIWARSPRPKIPIKNKLDTESKGMKRIENSVDLWVLEAKNCKYKKRYFCEFCIDDNCVRSSTKQNKEMLYWGEQLSLKHVPTVEVITLNIYRVSKSKKRDERNILVGCVPLSVAEIQGRQFTERWHQSIPPNAGTAGKELKLKGKFPLIRIKTRYQSVTILPLALYTSLMDYVTSDILSLVPMLEPIVSLNAKEELATALVFILQHLGSTGVIIPEIVMEEIDRRGNSEMTLLENSIAVCIVQAYMKLGDKYIKDTLGDFMRTVLNSSLDCEVVPSRVTCPRKLLQQQQNLTVYCDLVWSKITNSYCFFPNELRAIFAALSTKCTNRQQPQVAEHIISSSVFLRYICPAIMTPNLFDLAKDYPHEQAARNLTLVAKTLQNLANLTKFGVKEEYMTFMNGFFDRELENMKTFMHQISDPDIRGISDAFDTNCDIGMHLSVLNSILTETLEKLDKDQLEKFSRLKPILESINIEGLNPALPVQKYTSVSLTGTMNFLKNSVEGALRPKIPPRRAMSLTQRVQNPKPVFSWSTNVINPDPAIKAKDTPIDSINDMPFLDLIDSDLVPNSSADVQTNMSSSSLSSEEGGSPGHTERLMPKPRVLLRPTVPNIPRLPPPVNTKPKGLRKKANLSCTSSSSRSLDVSLNEKQKPVAHKSMNAHQRHTIPYSQLGDSFDSYKYDADSLEVETPPLTVQPTISEHSLSSASSQSAVCYDKGIQRLHLAQKQEANNHKTQQQVVATTHPPPPPVHTRPEKLRNQEDKMKEEYEIELCALRSKLTETKRKLIETQLHLKHMTVLRHTLPRMNEVSLKHRPLVVNVAEGVNSNYDLTNIKKGFVKDRVNNYEDVGKHEPKKVTIADDPVTGIHECQTPDSTSTCTPESTPGSTPEPQPEVTVSTTAECTKGLLESDSCTRTSDAE